MFYANCYFAGVKSGTVSTTLKAGGTPCHHSISSAHSNNSIPELCVYIQVLNCCLDRGSQLRLQLEFYEIPILNAGGEKNASHAMCHSH